MSDALLKEISTKLDKLIEAVSKGGATAAPDKAAAAAAAAKAAADNKAKAIADKAKADAAAKAAADKKVTPAADKPKGPAAGTKAPGGKHTVEQVREIVRKVANTDGLGKQSALDILKDDGNGAVSVKELKPEFYDAVFEAAEVLLGGEGSKEEATPDEEEDDFA